MSKNSVKIQDVAKYAGVSTATVSRALSSPGVVSETTRNQVLDAVKQTGYRVNRAARNLRTQRANAILVLLPNMGNPFFSQILQGIESVFSPAGFSMLVAETEQIVACGDHLTDYFRDGRADGMIVLDGSLDPAILEELADMPQSRNIVCACEWFQNMTFPSVRSANKRGSAAAIEYLYSLGHRDIAYISGPEGNVLTQARLESTLAAMEDLQIAPPERHIIQGDFSLAAGRIAAQEILKMRQKPTAVLCASDEIAIGLIGELTRNKVHVPDDISVIGFDDIEMAEHFIPPLTTMRQDRLAIGKCAAEIMVENLQANADDMNQEHIVKDVELIVRGSCKAIA